MKYWIVKYGDLPLKQFESKLMAKKAIKSRRHECLIHDYGAQGFAECSCKYKKEYTIHEVNEKLLEKGKI